MVSFIFQQVTYPNITSLLFGDFNAIFGSDYDFMAGFLWVVLASLETISCKSAKGRAIANRIRGYLDKYHEKFETYPRYFGVCNIQHKKILHTIHDGFKTCLRYSWVCNEGWRPFKNFPKKVVYKRKLCIKLKNIKILSIVYSRASLSRERVKYARWETFARKLFCTKGHFCLKIFLREDNFARRVIFARV